MIVPAMFVLSMFVLCNGCVAQGQWLTIVWGAYVNGQWLTIALVSSVRAWWRALFPWGVGRLFGDVSGDCFVVFGSIVCPIPASRFIVSCIGTDSFISRISFVVIVSQFVLFHSFPKFLSICDLGFRNFICETS